MSVPDIAVAEDINRYLEVPDRVTVDIALYLRSHWLRARAKSNRNHRNPGTNCMRAAGSRR
eukprot:277108-Rhodomonas_salina.1